MLSEKHDPESIAICGFACHLPGGSDSPENLWNLIYKGQSAHGDVPESRFNIDGFYHPQGMHRPGSMAMRGGYFLHNDVHAFENTFFDINNLEALYMDPQQKKLLEVVFQCLENAGIPLDEASGSNTGCYVGNFTADFQAMQRKEFDYAHRYTATGSGTTILANRISHVFNLLGPSLVIDTACSSSLYSLHVACSALENYECDAAIVAGANLILSPEQHMTIMKTGVLSESSTCHTFDVSADGYGRADGVGALYIKRLRDAIAHGDPIRSIIRGSAINANGRTAGVSLPSVHGQASVIRKALSRAMLSPDDIDYVECHGTGTKVGDSIEVEALAKVFQRTVKDPTLLIGSIKSNVGHSEAASGITSIIKAIMVMEHGLIPPTYGLTIINPKLMLEERNIAIPTKVTAWPDSPFHSSFRPRRIGINSFGYGGANAHCILESFPVLDPKLSASKHSRPIATQSQLILPLSAASVPSLAARVTDFEKLDFCHISLSDLAYTLGVRRTQLPVRGFFIASGTESIQQLFHPEKFTTSTAHAINHNLPYAFVFTGQGSQWPGMGRELLEEFSDFRCAIVEMDKTLQTLPHAPTWSLQETILETKDPNLIHYPERSQPCCTAIQVALIQLLASWDIIPTITVGHSSGEIAAAFAAGYISPAEAIIIAYYRGYVVSKAHLDDPTVVEGSMMAVGLSERSAEEEILTYGLGSQLGIACINSPESVTISGDKMAVEKLLPVLIEKGVYARILKTGGQAYHSHHMLRIGHRYEALLDDVLPSAGPSPRPQHGATFVSSVFVGVKSSGFGAHYWRQNLESQVRFEPAISFIQRQSDHFFIELGPHSSLDLPITQILGKAKISTTRVKYAAPIKRDLCALRSILNFTGSLWLQGCKINWSKVNGLQEPLQSSRWSYRVVASLPPYRFNYEEAHWTESRSSLECRQRKYLRHELLGLLMPGGNGRDYIFRNLLNVHDIPWIQDHKLGETVVFPGSGYLAMAMEAIMQVTSINRTIRHSFFFTNVNITNALALSTDHQSQRELFLSIHKTNLTKAATSSKWWEFNVSTYANGSSISHATGSIAVEVFKAGLLSKYQPPSDSLELTAKRTWYERLDEQGINYGSTFQTITHFKTPRIKSLLCCAADAPLLTVCGDLQTEYPVHPITLDALFQLTAVSASGGVPSDLRGVVPTRITSAIINTVSIPSGSSCHMNCLVQRTGFGSIESGSELVQSNGEVAVQFDQVKLMPYSAGTKSIREIEKRHPVLRLLWKPDVYSLSFMPAPTLAKVLHSFSEKMNLVLSDTSLLKLGGALDLLVHKEPQARILELGNENNELTTFLLSIVSSHSEFRRFSSYSTGYFNSYGSIIGGPVDPATGQRSSELVDLSSSLFNLILVVAAQPHIRSFLPRVLSSLDENALILILGSRTELEGFDSSGVAYLECPIDDNTAIFIARRAPAKQRELSMKPKFLIVERERSPLGSELMHALQAVQGEVVRTTLEDLTAKKVLPGITIFNLCELYSPLLNRINDQEMKRVKMMTDNAACLVWVTGGNIIRGCKPDLALAAGLARAVGMEQPSLKFYTYDVDAPDTHVDLTARYILSILDQQGPKTDMEFAQRDGIVHVSRLVPDDDLNALFRNKQGLETTTLSLKEAKHVQLSIRRPGQFDSVFFRQQEASLCLSPDKVRIKVASASINAKDFYVLAGKVETKDATCQCECTGIIVQVGSAVTDFAVGDRVVAMAPMNIETYQTLPTWACYKLEKQDNLDVCATLPVVYSTALYALHYRARIQLGESILIHSGAGGVGIAAIELALAAGAEVFTTVSTDEKRDYLIETFGLKPSNIFNSRGTSFLEGILQATAGRGVNVVINSLTGDQLQATWRCVADFGRFVEIGKTDISTAGRLEMDQFSKSTTFTAFDLSHLYYNKDQQSIWHSLLYQVMDLYHQGKIAASMPARVFDISKAADAFRLFASRNRIGKIGINFENHDSEIMVHKQKYATSFYPDKCYVMIGCLGGLGRTLTRWMASRGARKFAFLGRSGLQKASALNLIQDLNAIGAESIVITGDVCDQTDVEAVIDAAAALGRIGGIVQAAMGLNEAIFAEMPTSYWRTAIDPKVKGSWNLYNVLKEKNGITQLDFFLMTSSVSGSVGTATEANYCAANYFLDIFARYLRNKELPGISVGLGMISEVGYLHENPDIEALLRRKGIQPINANDMLQIIDLALSSANSMIGTDLPYDELAAYHLLTGLEASGIQELHKKGFEGNHPVLRDSRSGLLATALGENASNSLQHGQRGDLPAEIIKGMEAGQALKEAVLNHVRNRFANLVLMKPDTMVTGKPLEEYGMDSMLGAELRTWLYQTLMVDVPLSMLLGKTCTLEDLSGIAAATIEGKRTELES